MASDDTRNLPLFARSRDSLLAELTELRAAPSGTEAAVCADIARRQALGIAKYGTTVANNPLVLREWLQHQYEELLDAAVYTKRAIEEIDKRALPVEHPTEIPGNL